MSYLIEINNATQDQKDQVMNAWVNGTFRRTFLHGRVVKVTFVPGAWSGYTSPGGHIVLNADATHQNQWAVFLHELGHIADYWYLTDHWKSVCLAEIGVDPPDPTLWRYRYSEMYANSFARYYPPEGMSSPMWATFTEATMNGSQDGPTFSDVPETHPYYSEIEWAAENGVTNGYPDGTFKPDDDVSRGEMAVFLERANKVPIGTEPTR